MWVVTAAVLLFAVFVFAGVAFLRFLARFNRATQYITGKLEHARDEDEYRQWHQALCCHYLCLIPFVNDKNVMVIYRKLFHKTPRVKKENYSDGLYHMLAPSAIAVVMCTVCLCGSSWAWFTASQSGQVAQISTATYLIEVSCKIGDDSAHPLAQSDEGQYTLPLVGDVTCYEITIAASGTASTGYCTLTFGETTYHTAPIANGEQFVFQLVSYENGVLHMRHQWGTSTATEHVITQNTVLTLGTAP